MEYTDFDKQFAEMLDDKYDYIARDSEGLLQISTTPMFRETESRYKVWVDVHGNICPYVFSSTSKVKGGKVLASLTWGDGPVKPRDIYNPKILTEDEKRYLEAVYSMYDGVNRGITVEKSNADALYLDEYLKFYDPTHPGYTISSIVFGHGELFNGLKCGRSYNWKELGLFQD